MFKRLQTIQSHILSCKFYELRLFRCTKQLFHFQVHKSFLLRLYASFTIYS